MPFDFCLFVTLFLSFSREATTLRHASCLCEQFACVVWLRAAFAPELNHVIGRDLIKKPENYRPPHPTKRSQATRAHGLDDP
eukprot:4188225-Pleurochrysis_carterae.AAC.1